MASIYDITLASATLLEEYQSKGYDDLLSALKLADERIIAQIAKTNGIYTKKKLQEIKKLIDAEIAKSYGGVFASVSDESVAVASINYNAVLGYASMYSAIPEAAVKDLLSSTRQIQGYEFEELFKLSEANHARQLKVTIAAGMANNLTAQQLIREYNLKSNKLSKGQIKSNIFTVMTDSKNQGNYNAFEDLESRGLIKYYEHISVLDGRTSPICQAHDGRKYYKDLKDIKGINKPPLHFNCRSQLLPRTTEDKQLRTSQNGIIPEEKYPEWFKRQPDTFQKSVLGSKKYKLYKSGDYKIESLPDVLSGKKRSLNQYQKDVLSVNKNAEVPKSTPSIIKETAKEALEKEIIKDTLNDSDDFDFFASLEEIDNNPDESTTTLAKSKFITDMIINTKTKAEILDSKQYKSNSKKIAYNENTTTLTGKTSGSISSINEARKKRTLDQYARKINLLEEFKDKLEKGYLDGANETLLESYFDMIANQQVLKGDDFVQDFINLLSLNKSRIEQIIKTSNKIQLPFFKELLKIKE